jgi:serine/threonine-protein kinase
MRYMHGGSLAFRIEEGSVSLTEAVSIMVRLATALNEVHSHDIIHRDLKPSNILFDQWNEPFISDFGTAKPIQENKHLTETGGAVGTPAYMSPEQIQGTSDLDSRSDIYTMGIILFELLSGRHPYPTDTPIGVALSHITEPVPHILDVKPNLSSRYQAIISRAMAKRREERYPTAVAFAEALVEAVETSNQSYATGDKKAEADRPISQDKEQEKASPEVTSSRRLFSHSKSAFWITGILLGILLIFAGKLALTTYGQASIEPNEVVALPTSTSTATLIPTDTPLPTPSATTQPTTTPTDIPPTAVESIPTETSSPTLVPTASPTVDSRLAKANLSSSLFNRPDGDSRELAMIRVGEEVEVLGRTSFGQWLYVRNGEEIEGYVFRPRMEWHGDIEALATVIPPTPAPSSCNNGPCLALSLDMYPLPGSRCAEGIIYRDVYMRGQGGNQFYTYFWNGQQLNDPLFNEGLAFQVDNLSGPELIGMARVISGDGQVVEVEAYITDFDCGS